MCTAAVPPVPPMLWVIPISAPSTCLFPASPLNCHTISAAWAIPVAPSGWPLALRPPDGFTGIFPPFSVIPSSTEGPPSPFSTNPKSSIAKIPLI